MGSNVTWDIVGSGKPLEGVNINTTEEGIKIKYDKWAEEYDKDMISYNYQAPVIAVRAFSENAQKYAISKDAKVIDIGAGTGKIGELLSKEGYTNIDGLDISPDMLEVAKGKGCYKSLICGSIGNKSLAIPDDQYDALLCIGCVTLGHIKPNGISEMLDMIKPGGLYLFTIRTDAADAVEYGYKQIIDELVAEQKMRVIFKEKIGYLAATASEDLARYCYLYGFVKKSF